MRVDILPQLVDLSVMLNNGVAAISYQSFAFPLNAVDLLHFVPYKLVAFRLEIKHHDTQLEKNL